MNSVRGPYGQITKRDTREDVCKGMEYGGIVTGLIGDVSADINSIPVIGDMMGIVTGCISAVSHVTKAGMDITATALNCDDIPFEEIKEIMDKRFNEMERKLDKEAEALEEISKQISKTLSTVERTRSEMNKGFSRVLDAIQDNEIKSRVFKINNIAQYFNTEKNRVRGLPKEEFVSKLEEEDGILQHLKETRVPKEGTLQTALSEIVYNNYAIPKNANDQKAFQALYALFYGTQTYASIFCFLIEQNAYLADYYYQAGEYEKFNRETDKIKLVFEDFKSTLVGDKNAFINKVSEILKNVKSKDFVKNNDLFKAVSAKEKALNTIKEDIKKMTLPVIRDIPPKATISFKKPEYKTPLGEFENGKSIRYAVQFKKNGIFSKMSQWSNSIKIKGKASPYVRVPMDRQKRNRLIFRQIDGEQPKLIGILTERQTELRDINRELYDAARNIEKEDGFAKVKELVEDYEADVNAIFELGRTVLHAAAESGNVKVIQYIFKKGFKNKNPKDKKGYTPCHIAAGNGKEGFISPYLREDGDCNGATDIDKFTPLHLAVRNGYRSTVLTLAKQTGGYVDPYVDINAKDRNGYAALHMAVGGGDRLLGALFRQDINLNITTINGLTALHLAAIKDDVKIIETLSGSSTIVFDALDVNEMTPLHYASMLGHTGVVKYLMSLKTGEGYENKHGYPNINAQAKGNKWTPLHYALYFQKSETATELLKHNKINVNSEADGDVTPLHFSAMKGLKAAASQLIKKGAKLEKKTKEEYTALHLSAMHGDVGVTKLLLEKGASTTAKNNKGQTPLDIATKYENSEVQELLKSRSGRHVHLEYEKASNDLFNDFKFIEKRNNEEINYTQEYILNDRMNQSIKSNFFYNNKDLVENRIPVISKNFENNNFFQRSDIAPGTSIDVNGLLLMMDLLLKVFTKGKYNFIVDDKSSDFDLQARALIITEQYGKFLNKLGKEAEDNIDIAEVHSKVYKALKSGKEKDIESILCSYLETYLKFNPDSIKNIEDSERNIKNLDSEVKKLLQQTCIINPAVSKSRIL